MRKKYVTAGQATDHSIIRLTRFACWMTEATNTHSEYVILILFLLQQWLPERDSMLCCTYITCIVLISIRMLNTKLDRNGIIKYTVLTNQNSIQEEIKNKLQ